MLHPDCDVVYIFDNSQNHHARRPDALWAANLNLGDGGKNVKNLRDTTWNGEIQYMQKDDKQKGIRSILEERELKIAVKRIILLQIIYSAVHGGLFLYAMISKSTNAG